MGGQQGLIKTQGEAGADLVNKEWQTAFQVIKSCVCETSDLGPEAKTYPRVRAQTICGSGR